MATELENYISLGGRYIFSLHLYLRPYGLWVLLCSDQVFLSHGLLQASFSSLQYEYMTPKRYPGLTWRWFQFKHHCDLSIVSLCLGWNFPGQPVCYLWTVYLPMVESVMSLGDKVIVILTWLHRWTTSVGLSNRIMSISWNNSSWSKKHGGDRG